MGRGWEAFKILFWIGSAILIALFLLMIFFPLLLANRIADYWGINVWGLYGAVRQLKLGLLFLSMIYLLVSMSIVLQQVKKGEMHGKEEREEEKETETPSGTLSITREELEELRELSSQRGNQVSVDSERGYLRIESEIKGKNSY